MKALPLVILFGLLVNFVLSGYLLLRDQPPRESVVQVSEGGDLAALEQAVVELRRQLEELRNLPLSGSRAAEQNGVDDRDELKARLREIERSIAGLESAMAGVDLEAASVKRGELFRGADGDVKASEYFEAGKYASAGEGYLTFLAANPDHPEHRSIVERARQAFVRAGNLDKALAVQQEMMEMYPDMRSGDLMTLARLQKDSGSYAAAAQSAKDSAELVNDSSKYWNLLYSAWYTQLGDGLAAGLAAHRDVQRQINGAGLADSKMAERVQEKIAEIENQIAAEGN